MFNVCMTAGGNHEEDLRRRPPAAAAAASICVVGVTRHHQVDYTLQTLDDLEGGTDLLPPETH